jgi:predicted nucleic acid-binding protein
MQYLVDTGVWLRLFDRNDPHYADIRTSLRSLQASGHILSTCPQNIAEFWNVSTRPSTARGGYGKNTAMTELRARFIERSGVILEETPAAYHEWRRLLVQHQIQGVAVHDARLVSMMNVAGIIHIITLNGADFARYPGIIAFTPRQLASEINP